MSNVHQRPLPPFRRMMIFVDGENLVCRYQHLVSKCGRISKPTVRHVKDILVWEEHFTELAETVGLHEVVRATYYTYVVGADDKVDEIEDKLKSLKFRHRDTVPVPEELSPVVFKKKAQQARAKGVDIAIAVDVMTQVHQGNVDTVFLLSGDGGYLPLMNEVVRCGKQVFVAAFSSGLDCQLRRVATKFDDLDRRAFQPP
jgi:uncharacterized LabA/DUF88 family protein